MERHELSGIFPPLSDYEYQELVESIKTHGFQGTIDILDGKILDGWHRYRACNDADVQPKFAEYTGPDPLDYVAKKNLSSRRNLTKEQRVEVEKKLRERGWSFPRIASTTNTPETTVRRDLSSAGSPNGEPGVSKGSESDMPDKVKGADQKNYPARKYTDEERARALELLDQGWSVQDVADEIGCAVNSIYNWKQKHDNELKKEKSAAKAPKQPTDEEIREERLRHELQIRRENLRAALRYLSDLGDADELATKFTEYQLSEVKLLLPSAMEWLEKFSASVEGANVAS